MPERTVGAVVRVVNPHGMHLRPADLFVRTALRFQSKVSVTFEGQQVDGRSIVELLMLAARIGTQLTITVCGNDAEEALAALVQLVERGFDELEDKGKTTDTEGSQQESS